jgi:hypothetical protein
MNERELFTNLGTIMLKIYEKFPQNGSKRKVLSGTEKDPEKRKNIIMFFKEMNRMR